LEKLSQALQIIYYLVWIPVGLLILGLTAYLIVAKPWTGMAKVMEDFQTGLKPGINQPLPQGQFPEGQMPMGRPEGSQQPQNFKPNNMIQPPATEEAK
jgi:hypothetical protein